MRRMHGWQLVLVVGAFAGIAGCSSSSTPDRVSTQSGGHTLHVDEKQDGTTVQAHVGDTVVVTLHSTYWQLTNPGGGVVHPLTCCVHPAAAATTPCPSIPGSGCGTVTRSYEVAKSGATTLSAQRGSCGEALACSPAQSHWSVRLVATNG